MRRIPFFRKVLSKNQQVSKEQENTYNVNVIEVPNEENANEPSQEIFTLNDSDDDFSSNLLAIVFGVIEERRKMSLLIAKQKEQIAETQTINASIVEEKRQLTNYMGERENQLKSLQYQINEYQDKYQELIEDYKELEISELKERQKLQQQIKELQANYDALADELKQYREETRIKNNRYKDELRQEKEKYTRLLLQHKKLSEDNTSLVEKIASFTKQISSVQMLNNIISDEHKMSETNNT